MDRRIEQLEQQVASQSKEIADLKRQQAMSRELQHLGEIKKLRSSRTHHELYQLDDNMMEVTSQSTNCPPTSQPQWTTTSTVPTTQTVGAPPLFTTLNHLPQHPYSMNPLVHPPNAIPPTLTTTEQCRIDPNPHPITNNAFLKPSKLSNRFSMPASQLISQPVNYQQTTKTSSHVVNDSEEEEDEDDNNSITYAKVSKRASIAHNLLEHHKPPQHPPLAEQGPFGRTADILADVSKSQGLHHELSMEPSTESQEQSSAQTDAIYVSCPMEADPDDDLKHYKLSNLILASSLQACGEQDSKFYPIMVTIGPNGKFQRLPSDTEFKGPKFKFIRKQESSTVDKVCTDVDVALQSWSGGSLIGFKNLFLNTSSFYSHLRGASGFAVDHERR